MIPVLHLQAIAETTLTGILICFAGGIPAALVAWILLRAFKGQNSSTRFVVLFSTLLAILLLPLTAHLRNVAGKLVACTLTIVDHDSECLG